MSERYALRKDNGTWLNVVDPFGNKNSVEQPAAIHFIRQLLADIAERDAQISELTAERDEARTAYQVRNTEWHQHELIALALAERHKLRAERAEAELARMRAQEPVAWMWNDEIGVPHASAGSKKPVWLESSASAEYIKQANLRPLYAAPPAPVAEIREVVVVTRPMCHGAWARFWSESNSGDSCDQAMRWLEAWRAELGPTLGLVELKEPTPEECERIDRLYAASDRTSHGRAMFNACRAVMWPKEGL